MDLSAIDLGQFVAIFSNNVAFGKWDVRGTNGERHTVLVTDLKSKEVADAVVRKLTDDYAEQLLQDLTSQPVRDVWPQEVKVCMFCERIVRDGDGGPFCFNHGELTVTRVIKVIPVAD